MFKLDDNNNNNLSTIILWNNETTTNNYLFNSVNFQEIDNLSNILNIKNSSNDIQIKNNGNITIKDVLEINKTNETTTLKNNLILKSLDSAPTASTLGINGQINYFNNELFIYLGNMWKKVNLTNL